MTVCSAALLLFLVMDSFGNVLLYLSGLHPVAPERQRKVIARELLITLDFLNGSSLVSAIYRHNDDADRYP